VTNILTALALGLLPTAWARLQFAHIRERASQVKDTYEYVIIGAGTAGLTVADRLTEGSKYTVLVIECGYAATDAEIKKVKGRTYKDLPDFSYNITSISQPGMLNRTQKVVVGCTAGGSSAIKGVSGF
ncbi:hypothetical protein QBC46DRAFT_264095, partial [Diplogelasinospora grovesii]